MKIGSGKPVVGATLVVARSRHQPVFISLCGLHNAMVIPNAAKRSEESRISRYRSRAIRNTFYFLPLPAISAPSAVSPTPLELTNKNTCTTLSTSGHTPHNFTITRRIRRNTTECDTFWKSSPIDSRSPCLHWPLSIAQRSPHNFTITREMQQNATECTLSEKISQIDRCFALPRIDPSQSLVGAAQRSNLCKGFRMRQCKGRGVNMPMNRLPDRPKLAQDFCSRRPAGIVLDSLIV